jgi:hypothetical protein
MKGEAKLRSNRAHCQTIVVLLLNSSPILPLRLRIHLPAIETHAPEPSDINNEALTTKLYNSTNPMEASQS